MVNITFIEPDGTERAVDVYAGMSLMQAAIGKGVAGIIAECGGNCACGTCRVFVDPAWQQAIGAPGETEQAMIAFIGDGNPDLRLSCQVQVTDALDGMVVQVSPDQH